MNETRYKKRMEALKKLPLREQIRRLKTSCGKYRHETEKLRGEINSCIDPEIYKEFKGLKKEWEELKNRIKKKIQEKEYYENECDRLKQTIERLQVECETQEEMKDQWRCDFADLKRKHNIISRNWFVKLFLIKKNARKS